MRPSHPPDTPQDAIAFLVELDPPFETELEAEDRLALGYHRLMQLFAVYFAANCKAFSPKRLRLLGAWLSASVDAGGDIENAVSTCFLEHARQLHINRLLAPYLSQSAKGKTHA